MKSQFLKQLLYLNIRWISSTKTNWKKRETLKNSLFDYLINYVPNPTKKN